MSDVEEKKEKPIRTLVQCRIIAVLIDWGIISLVFVFLEIIPLILSILYIVSFNNSNFELYDVVRILVYIAYPVFTLFGIFALLYYYIIWPLKHSGQTIGKNSQKIQIVIQSETEDSSRLLTMKDLRLSFKRFLASLIDSLAWGLVGLIFLLKSEDNEMLCDKLTGTAVVEYIEE